MYHENRCNIFVYKVISPIFCYVIIDIIQYSAVFDAEGVLGVLKAPKWSFRHPQGVQIAQGVQMGVQIIQLYISVWYTDLHNNIIHCSHLGAFYGFLKMH
jgi:hypothetical protein